MDKQTNKYRWVIFASVLLTYLLMSSQRTAPGLITDQLMVDFNVTAATIGLVISIQFFVYTSLQIPMGLLSDRYGPNLLLIVGALLTGIGTIIYSMSSHVFLLFVSRTLTGIGDATVWVCIVLILNQLFTAKEFTRYIGIAGMTGSLGFLMATVPASSIITLFGWRVTFFSAGLLLISCSMLLYFIFSQKSKQPLLIKRNLKHEKPVTLIRKVFSNRQAVALFLCHFGVVGGYIGFIGSWAVPYMMNVYGLTRIIASELIMVSLVGALIGAPFISWLSSRLGTIKWLYMIFHVIILLSWSSFLLFTDYPPFYILVILFIVLGFSFGSNSLTFALVRQSFSLSEAGVISGFANTGGFLSAVMLPSIFGYILDHFQSMTGNMVDGYYFAFFTPVIFAFIGLVGVMIIKD